MNREIEIRPAHQWMDFLQCEELQRQVWHMPNERDIVPAHLLITAHKNGGLLLAAFDGVRMVGFVFSFLGQEGLGAARRLKHCSHLLAVVSDYRARGLGLALKKQQRAYLLAQGLDLVTWTYDPLQAVNATLNLGRLGAIARRYLPDAYGEMTDGLNAGVSSDRFEVEWWLDDARVLECLAHGREEPSGPVGLPLYEISFESGDLPRVTQATACEGPMCLAEIPADWNKLKRLDLPLAQAWRQRTRETFSNAFSKGFAAVGFKNWTDREGRRRTAYILQKLI